MAKLSMSHVVIGIIIIAVIGVFIFGGRKNGNMHQQPNPYMQRKCGGCSGQRAII